MMHESDRRSDTTTQAQQKSSRSDRLRPPVLEADLPVELANTLGRLLGTPAVPTLEDWVGAVRRHTGGAIAVEELCHTDSETPHRGVLDGETYYFQCFFDAIVLAGAVEEPVAVRTESPDGASVEASAVGTADLTVDPPSAVFSFGVDTAVEPPGAEGPTNEDVYAAVCPWVRAFPDIRAYRDWAETVPAATVVVPFAEATTIAAALVD